ncbi:Hypothetical_protein [Hexamita inflata]|uniref:Hypothetical_protein n=1 Tax=Hexamita inflata TaxID=28002 RepID=A0AA86R1K0_9EUKA|nr:Hypothetical protein HINF_LOCUS57681 [Hexamita inflata]
MPTEKYISAHSFGTSQKHPLNNRLLQSQEHFKMKFSFQCVLYFCNYVHKGLYIIILYILLQQSNNLIYSTKITLKSNNAEAQSENDKKQTQSSAKITQKETQAKKDNKQPVIENSVKSQPIVGQNEQKTITDAKQETEPILTKDQNKKQHD